MSRMHYMKKKYYEHFLDNVMPSQFVFYLWWFTHTCWINLCLLFAVFVLFCIAHKKESMLINFSSRQGFDSCPVEIKSNTNYLT